MKSSNVVSTGPPGNIWYYFDESKSQRIFSRSTFFSPFFQWPKWTFLQVQRSQGNFDKIFNYSSTIEILQCFFSLLFLVCFTISDRQVTIINYRVKKFDDFTPFCRWEMKPDHGWFDDGKHSIFFLISQFWRFRVISLTPDKHLRSPVSFISWFIFKHDWQDKMIFFLPSLVFLSYISSSSFTPHPKKKTTQTSSLNFYFGCKSLNLCDLFDFLSTLINLRSASDKIIKIIRTTGTKETRCVVVARPLCLFYVLWLAFHCSICDLTIFALCLCMLIFLPILSIFCVVCLINLCLFMCLLTRAWSMEKSWDFSSHEINVCLPFACARTLLFSLTNLIWNYEFFIDFKWQDRQDRPDRQVSYQSINNWIHVNISNNERIRLMTDKNSSSIFDECCVRISDLFSTIFESHPQAEDSQTNPLIRQDTCTRPLHQSPSNQRHTCRQFLENRSNQRTATPDHCQSCEDTDHRTNLMCWSESQQKNDSFLKETLPFFRILC